MKTQIIFLALLTISISANSQTIITSKKAAEIRSYVPNDNYGACTELRIDNYNAHSLIEFNISSIKSKVDSVYFYIYKTDGNPATSGRVVEMFRITGSWEEGDSCRALGAVNAVTFNTKPSSSTATDGSWNQVPVQTWVKVDITVAVNAAIANGDTTIGWAMRGKYGCACSEYYAGDDSLGYEPRIEVYKSPVNPQKQNAIISLKAAEVRSYIPNDNYGTCTELRIDNYNAHSLVEFNISKINKQADSIFLYIHKTEGNPATSGRIVDMFRLTGNWDEGDSCRAPANGNALTYNNKPSVSPTADASWNQAPDHSWIKVDLTAAINAAIANGDTIIGWAMKGRNGCLCSEYYASDDSLGYEPFLSFFPDNPPCDTTTTCDSLKLTCKTYPETASLNDSIKAELGNTYVIADFNELLTNTNLNSWASCMKIVEDATFMVTYNGYYMVPGTNRQYYVHYSTDGVPYPNFAIHAQSGDFYLGSWYGLDQSVLASQTSPTVSIDETEMIESLAYPNPTDGDLTIDLGNSDQLVTIKIYNSLGQLVQYKEYSRSQDINLSIKGKSGVYFLKVDSGNGAQTMKIIKQ